MIFLMSCWQLDSYTRVLTTFNKTNQPELSDYHICTRNPAKFSHVRDSVSCAAKNQTDSSCHGPVLSYVDVPKMHTYVSFHSFKYAAFSLLMLRTIQTKFVSRDNISIFLYFPCCKQTRGKKFLLRVCVLMTSKSQYWPIILLHIGCHYNN